MIPEETAYLDSLNDVQRKAVTTIDGPVMVIAGPGSGKTRVLTYRIAHLIKAGVPPYQILALTFTNKAAAEMKERISKVVGNKSNQLWAGTFHSIFARILRYEADKIGYPSSFTIYDSQDSKSLINTIVKEMNLDAKTYNSNGVLNRISNAKTNLISSKMYKDNVGLRAQDRNSKRPKIADIYRAYSIRCKRAGAMDFDDLLYQTYVLLHKNPDGVLEKYRDKFRYVLVDEFQDTNHLQYSIIKKLVNFPNSPRNLCVVGDDAQSIYAFRGATIDNILNFQKEYKNLKTYKLEQNYRSTNHIVEAANQLILKNNKQIQKKIWSSQGEGNKIKLIKAVSDVEEAKRIAELILEQKTRNHLNNSDIAILYRTNAQSRVFEEHLRRHNIQYKVYGGLSFYQRKEIKDLLGYLKLVVNPKDEEALKRVINFPKRAIGNTSFDKIAKIANDNLVPIWDVLKEIDKWTFPTRLKTSIKKFVNLIVSLQKNLEVLDAYQLAVMAGDKSGLIATYQKDKTIEGMNRVENLRELLNGIKEFVESDEVIEDTESDDKSLTGYLQNIMLYTDQDKDSDETDRVLMMSVHASKGLEFESVFVAGLEKDLFPSKMAIESREGIDEERRLFYVAITRAKQFLCLSYARSRYRFGNMVTSSPSNFLGEIGEENLEQAMNTFSPSSGRSSSDRRRLGPTLQQQRTARPRIDIDNFEPSPISAIQVGKEVEHLRFGKGVIKTMEGAKGNEVATVLFEEVGEKRIMIKYAKLKVYEL